MAENKRFFYGWLILLTCILIMGLGYAPLVSCASLFTKPADAYKNQKVGNKNAPI